MIDFHTHPVLVRELYAKEKALAQTAKEVFHIGNNPQPLETFLLELDVSGLEKAVLLPIDARTARGVKICSNELIAEMCKMNSRFIGFASVDPHQKNAPAELENAVKVLGLKGLKLSPPTQEFFPNDKKTAYPIYEKAQSLKIPLLIHAGMSWEPGAKLQYCAPLLLEDAACDFPDLNIVIAHFGWPWVLETVALALKYPNIYVDTSCLYFGNPKEFLRFVFTQQVPLSVIEKSLSGKIVFGSNYPRVEIKNMVSAVKSLGLSEECLKLIFETNAQKLLGENKQDDNQIIHERNTNRKAQ